MTQNEARAYLNLKDEQDLEEQIEFALFDYKQKIYRQLDQVLLYTKWLASLQRLQKAADTLDFSFPDQQKSFEAFELSLAAKASLIHNFNAYQQEKARAAHLIYQASSPIEISAILKAFLKIQLQWFDFWSQAKITTTEVQLSMQFDPQEIYLILKNLDIQRVFLINELNESNTPDLLRRWISWQTALLQKIQSS